MMALLPLLWWGCSGSEADESTLPPIADPPQVPALGAPPYSAAPPTAAASPAADSPAPQVRWALDTAADAEPIGAGPSWGPLGDGRTGARLRDVGTGFCTPTAPIDPAADLRVTVALGVTAVAPGATPEAGLTVEARWSDGAGAALPDPAQRLTTLRAPAAWSTSSWTLAPPRAAARVRVCASMRDASGDAAIDDIALFTGAPGPAGLTTPPK